MKRTIISSLLTLALVFDSAAQCAMCRTILENNISQGNPGIAAGINFGILYLLFTPYLAIAVIAFFWFRVSKRNTIKLDGTTLAR